MSMTELRAQEHPIDALNSYIAFVQAVAEAIYEIEGGDARTSSTTKTLAHEVAMASYVMRARFDDEFIDAELPENPRNDASSQVELETE